VRSRLGAAVAGAFVATTALVAVPAPAGAGTTDVVGGAQLGEKGVVVAYGAGARPLPPVVAGGWLIADAGTGEVLAAKGAHRLLRPASTIKTLTALTVLDSLALDAEHEVAWAEAAADGGKVGIVPGATYTVEDLLHGLLLPSGNDAAEALAAANGGRAETVARMQALADELGAADTTVRNPSGLDADGQVTSAYDLALIARAALAVPAFAELTATVSYDFPGRPVKAGKKRATYKIYTQNRLLTGGYRGAIGGKTGYTTLAGRTFWGAATRDGRTLVVTLLRIGGSSEASARALLDWGFANADRVTPVGTLVEPGTEPTAAPVAQQAAAQGVVASATDPAAESSSTWVPWLIVALLLLAGGIALWWGRLHDAVRGGTDSPDDELPAARDPSPAAPAVTATEARPRTPARHVATGGSVTVRSSRPGPPAHAAGAGPTVPTAAAPSGTAEAEAEVPVEVEGEVEAPAPAQPPIERARPRPVSGGHVKVIGPVTRPERGSDR
jgi:D-alanyl-D-alanine carboxypeptidase (penicillin-binding protein 5/6)